MNEEKLEVLRGHLEECFEHYRDDFIVKMPKHSHGSLQAKQLIADFCGVNVAAVNDWLYNDRLPTGETRLKLMCYLDLAGYKVIEQERMAEGRRRFAELIGFGIFSGEIAAKLVGYSKTSSLYDVLFGKQGSNDAKNRVMWTIWKEKKEELEKKKEQSRKVYQPLPQIKVETKAVVDKPRKKPHRQQGVVKIMEGLSELLEESFFEDLSKADLVYLQRSTNTVLLLSARLSALSSKLYAAKERQGGI